MVRWNKGGTVRAGDYNFFYGQRNKNHQLGTGFFVHHQIISSLMTVKSVSDRVSYIVLRGRWCNIALNVHAPIAEKSDDLKTVLMRKYGRFFYLFPKWHMKILLKDFNAKEGRIFSNQQMGARVYIGIVMIMVLE